MNHLIRSRSNVVNNEYEYLQWLNVYIEQLEICATFLVRINITTWWLKINKSWLAIRWTLFSKNPRTFKKMWWYYDDDCLRIFSETNVKESTTNKNSDNKTQVADQGKNKKRKPSTLEARNELWSIFATMEKFGKEMEENETSNNQLHKV